MNENSDLYAEVTRLRERCAALERIGAAMRDCLDVETNSFGKTFAVMSPDAHFQLAKACAAWDAIATKGTA